MWFLIKAGFWFTLVLVMLPFFSPAASTKLDGAPQMAIGETFSAATEAISYLKGLCVEKPEVCEKGGETFVALGHRAREGARIAYEFLNTQFATETVAEDIREPAFNNVPELAAPTHAAGSKPAEPISAKAPSAPRPHSTIKPYQPPVADREL